VPNHQLRITATIRAPPEKIFRAWTDPALICLWLQVGRSGRKPFATTDPRVGGTYRFELSSSGRVFFEAGTYRTVRPAEQLVYTCRFGSPGFTDAYEFTTRVDLNRVTEATRIIVRAYGFPRREQRDEHRAAWPVFLRRLAAVCEGCS
jgi:uncharacterized protein YndB with AHSA1/START domain